jgi:hypothetical protein
MDAFRSVPHSWHQPHPSAVYRGLAGCAAPFRDLDRAYGATAIAADHEGNEQDPASEVLRALAQDAANAAGKLFSYDFRQREIYEALFAGEGVPGLRAMMVDTLTASLGREPRAACAAAAAAHKATLDLMEGPVIPLAEEASEMLWRIVRAAASLIEKQRMRPNKELWRPILAPYGWVAFLPGAGDDPKVGAFHLLNLILFTTDI